MNHNRRLQMSADHVNMLILARKLEIGSTLVLKHPIEAFMYTQSTKDIKKKIKGMRRICMRCKAVETKEKHFKACARCQGSFYCSKECQKSDWLSSHKANCVETQKKKRVERLIGALIANNNFFGFLKIAIILRLGLHTAPLPAEPFTALVPLVVEPEDILDFARLHGDLPPRTTTNPAQKMKGMLQVGGAFANPESPELKEKRLDLIRELLGAHPATFEPGSMFGIVCFSMGDPATIIEVPTIISPELMAIAIQAVPFVQTIRDVTREHTATLPLHFFSCVEYINTTIRRDTDNRLLLREKMTEDDEKIITQSATDYDRRGVGGFGCRIIDLRIKNEYIYQPILKDPEKEI